MYYVPFHDYSWGYSGKLPYGNYGLLEYYCVTPDCDCRRVMLHVLSEQLGQIVAVVNFGWESKKFYAKWLGGDNIDDWIHDIKGPSLNSTSPQSPYADELLAIIRDVTLKDKDYVERLKRHYDMFKQKVIKKGVIREDNQKETRQFRQIGRNDPCTCGSGQKYKKCCGKLPLDHPGA